MKIIFVLWVLILFSAAPVFACLQSTGESEKDKKVPARVCNALKGDSSILMESVQESILYVQF